MSCIYYLRVEDIKVLRVDTVSVTDFVGPAKKNFKNNFLNPQNNRERYKFTLVLLTSAGNSPTLRKYRGVRLEVTSFVLMDYLRLREVVRNCWRPFSILCCLCQD